MTVIAASITFEDFEAALEQASAVDLMPTGPSALSLGGILGSIESAWDVVKVALNEAFKHGSEALQGAQSRAWAAIDDAIGSAKGHAQEVREAIRRRLVAFVENAVDAALARVRAQVSVGGTTLHLTSVDIAYRVSTGGSVGASLTEACTVAAEGEITVNATYGPGDPPVPPAPTVD